MLSGLCRKKKNEDEEEQEKEGELDSLLLLFFFFFFLFIDSVDIPCRDCGGMSQCMVSRLSVPSEEPLRITTARSLCSFSFFFFFFFLLFFFVFSLRTVEEKTACLEKCLLLHSFEISRKRRGRSANEPSFLFFHIDNRTHSSSF